MEAAGQLFHLFRDGLDYAFIPASFARCVDAGRVIGTLFLALSRRRERGLEQHSNPSAGSFAAMRH